MGTTILMAISFCLTFLFALLYLKSNREHMRVLELERSEAEAHLAHIAQLKAAQEELDQLTQQNYILHEINKAINASLNKEEIVTIILQALVTLTGAEKATIMLLEEEEPPVRIVTASGFDDFEAEVAWFNENYRNTQAWQVMQTGETYVNRDKEACRGFGASTNNYIASIPLVYNKEVNGAINVHAMGKNYDFTPSKEEFIHILAGQAALALKNASLYNQIKKQSEIFEQQAVTDGLTGLYNHLFFQQKLGDEMDRSQRYMKNLSLLLFDIDHFKSFNDTYGHQFGDTVLKEIAKIVHDCIRNVDLAARYGGEEFAVILPNTPLEGAMLVAERMRKSVEDHVFQNEDGSIQARVTISIGLTEWDRTQTKPQFIAVVDQALYRAKRTGRNRVCVGVDENLIEGTQGEESHLS